MNFSLQEKGNHEILQRVKALVIYNQLLLTNSRYKIYIYRKIYVCVYIYRNIYVYIEIYVYIYLFRV